MVAAEVEGLMANRPGRPRLCDEPQANLNVRLPASLYDAVIQHASSERSDVSTVVRTLLAIHFCKTKIGQLKQSA